MNSPAPFGGEAKWIWSREGIGSRPTSSHDHYRVRFFRREFSGTKDGRLILHVSADSRYVFWFNGTLIGRGPIRGDIAHHFYDTYDLTPHLREGSNLLAFQVIYCGDVLPTYHTTGAPCGLMTGAPGFILDGVLTDADGSPKEALHTNSRWLVRSDEGAYRHEHCEGKGTYTGFTERFFAEVYPFGWNTDPTILGFEPATEIFEGVRPDNVRDSFMPHRLMPRPIPFLENQPQAFGGRILGQEIERTLPALSRVTSIYFMPTLTTAMPRLRWSGGRAARIRLTYAEALPEEPAKGETVPGVYDEIHPGGHAEESWQSWHYRTFRYVKVEIETADEPLEIHSFDSVFWAYPLQMAAAFTMDDPFYSQLVETGFRTLRLCSHETYEDCPYYEQLSYAADNYVASQLAATLAGEFTLTAHTLREFFWSRTSEGLTQSRYPCRMPQIIPAWSQFWLLNVHTYFQNTGDTALVREVLPGIESVLAWFEQKREDGGEGVVGKLNYWCVLDWSPDWAKIGTPESGIPPGTYSEASAANSLLHLWCLKAAAALNEALDERQAARAHERRAKKLARQINLAFWDSRRGAYRDRRTGENFSQITQALAILSEAAPAARWPLITPHLLDPTFSRTAYFGQYFIFEALAQAGEFARAWPAYEAFRELFAAKPAHPFPEPLTTFPAIPDSHRSLCHAWSAGSVHHLFASGLGIRPLEPGWRAIRIAPSPGPHSTLRGAVPTLHGPITVELHRQGNGWSGFAETPVGIPVTVQLPGESPKVFPEGGRILFSE